MPDINLAQNTSRPEAAPKPRPMPGEPELTNPGANPTGLGGIFRSMFRGKKVADVDPVAGTPVRKNARANDRILSEKRSDAAPSLIPLPDAGELEVNLLSEEMSGQFVPRTKFLQLGLAVVGAVVLVGGAYLGLTFYEKSIDKQVTTTKEEVVTVQREVEDLKKQAVTVQTTTDKLKAIKTLLGNHVHWTSFFYQLEKYTLPSVTYGASFSANIQGQVTLSATTDTFEHAAQQYLVYQDAVKNNDFIKNFTITAATKQKTKNVSLVSFSVILDLLPSVFTQQVATTAKNSDLLISACYLLAHPADVSFLPVNTQADFAPAKLPVNQELCNQVTAKELDAGKSLVSSDPDLDGLVNYLELIAGTPTDNPDSDKDGLNDLQELMVCANPLGTGQLTACDPLHPLTPKL